MTFGPEYSELSGPSFQSHPLPPSWILLERDWVGCKSQLCDQRFHFSYKLFRINMCGIFCCLVPHNTGDNDDRLKILTDTVINHLRRRGPDHLNERKLVVEAHEHKAFCLSFIGTVLHLRGELTPQPICDDSGNVLLWNGEVFGGIQVDDNNDSIILLQTLVNRGTSHPTQHVLNTLSAVQGPWAIIFWQAQEKKLWFGRDYFGRRSLLWHLPSSPDDLFAVTSVACRAQSEEEVHWVEVPADGVYCLHVDTSMENSNRTEDTNCLSDRLEHFCWASSVSTASGQSLCSPVEAFNKTLPTDRDLEFYATDIQEVKQPPLLSAGGCDNESYEHRSEDSVCPDFNKPRLSTLSVCSKGTDPINEQKVGSDDNSEVQQIESNTSPCNETDSQTSSRIASILVEPPTSLTSRIASLTMCDELAAAEPNEPQNTVVDTFPLHGEKIAVAGGERTDSGPPNFHSSDSIAHRLISVLGKAVQDRVFNLPRNVSNGTSSNVKCTNLRAEGAECLSGRGSQHTTAGCRSQDRDRPAEVGILFSGGIDSMVLAALADRFVPAEEPIDLINVAFGQKPRDECSQTANKKKKRASKKVDVSRTKSQQVKLNYEVPDRITGKNGLKELSQLNKTRQWRFVEVNVDLEELKSMRSRHITHLVSPLDTVLDDSIGCALWFAARGTGILRCPSCISENVEDIDVCCHQAKYTSKAKVLLVGMGADEQLGGYARHRTRFSQEGWPGLVDEIEMEVSRISTRNLGRDDRCISDHGREARFPFLDEHVVTLLNELPVWIKTDPRLPRGVGEKRLLRHAARLLGLTSSSALPKRAIQFGSRIAKLESTGEKGSETCYRLT